jgi:hypothetical protein
MLDFEALQTPPGDGEVLIEPAGPAIHRALEQNRSNARSESFTLSGTPIQDVRRNLRQSLKCPSDAPCIVTGHQPDFAHPGVWAKYVVADEIARAIDASPLHLVVDNDAVKHNTLTVPAFTPTGIENHPIPFTAISAHAAYENVPAMTTAESQTFVDAVAKACVNLQDHAVADYFDGFRAATDPTDFVDQNLAGAQALNALHNVHCVNHRVSRVFTGPLISHLIADAGNFAAAYNRALADYRRRHRIRQPNRPIPDLIIDGDRIELPLWAYRPGELRHRVFVDLTPSARALYAETDPIGTLPLADLQDPSRAAAALAQLTRPLRPRALTLTLWARLLLADLFIHGIGGAKYDRITDRLIADYFRLTPPVMMCVTATLRIDSDLPRPSLAAHRAALNEIRQIRYNPHQYVKNAPAPLLEKRHELITRSNQLRRETPADHFNRRETFLAIRNTNQEILTFAPDLETEIRQHAHQLHQQLAQRRLADSREYFIAFHSKQKLSALAEKLRTAARVTTTKSF